MNSWRVAVGDALERLRELEDGSVQTCVTSPPYFGLRDYGTGEWAGGDDGCDHVERMARGDAGRPATEVPRGTGGAMVPSGSSTPVETPIGYRDLCGKCGATRTDSQLGLEATPDEYVARLVEVFRSVRRVLRDDGTLWLNLGDSYAQAKGHGHWESRNGKGDENEQKVRQRWRDVDASDFGVKPKDLLGIPWMVAFALRTDGWYLRSDIVWAKPNPMPESVTDRPTKSHEYVFLLSKSKSYFYDADAIREDDGGKPAGNGFAGRSDHRISGGLAVGGTEEHWEPGGGRNKRSVWTVATQPYAQAHFATFPPKLIEPCVLAGSAEDACGVCGAPWQRMVEANKYEPPSAVVGEREVDATRGDKTRKLDGKSAAWREAQESRRTLGFEPSCTHQDKTGSSVVLDPFSGAGTTGLVATRLGRSYIGIELNPTYAEMSRERIRDDAPLMNYILEQEEVVPTTYASRASK